MATLLCFGVAFTVGCAAQTAAPASVSATEPVAPPLQLGALTDFVPAAGLRWLLTGSPRYWAQQPALAGMRERWLTDQRLQAFAKATGIDLLRTEHALVAGFDLGTLYLADGSGWTQKPELPFIERLAGSARVQRTHPSVWRVTGLVGATPQALVRLADAVVAVAVQDPLLARVVEYRARGRLSNVVPALHGAALSALPAEFLEPGPLGMYALGPWPASALPEGAGLLSAALGVAALTELEGNALRVRIALAGAWRDRQDEEQLLGLWQALSTSPLGHALHLDQPRVAPSAHSSEQALGLDVELDAEQVLAGLESVAAGRWEPVLGAPSGSESPQSPP
jgi:hypothetical protein